MVNAAGTLTLLGGSTLDPEVLDAMADAARSFVSMEELHKKTGELIAKITGAKAGYVTAGAAAGLVLAIAACMTRGDLEKAYRLPDSEGMKNEIIIQRKHKCPYTYVLKIPGARIVYVGGEDGAQPSDIEGEINERTAAVVYFVFDPQDGVVPLYKIIEIAHAHDVPVIVDAAAELPPVNNIRKFVKMGADLVVFSGGKDIGGPNDTGILCGKKELVDFCVKLGPHHSDVVKEGRTYFIGRPMKTSKEDIVGLIIALQKYVKTDHEARIRRWKRKVGYMVKNLRKLPKIKVSKILPRFEHEIRPLCVPRVEINLNEHHLSANEVLKLLEEGDPPIRAYSIQNKVYINPQCLKDGEEDIIINRLRKILCS